MRTCKKVCKESDSWRKKNTRTRGIPNIGRVRVLVIHCKWLKSLIDINIDMQVSYRVGIFCSKFTIVL